LAERELRDLDLQCRHTHMSLSVMRHIVQ